MYTYGYYIPKSIVWLWGWHWMIDMHFRWNLLLHVAGRFDCKKIQKDCTLKKEKLHTKISAMCVFHILTEIHHCYKTYSAVLKTQPNQVWVMLHRPDVDILELCLLYIGYQYWIQDMSLVLMLSCTDIWSKKMDIQIMLSGHYTNFPYIHEAFTLYSYRLAYTNRFYYGVPCWHIYSSSIV